MRHGNLTSFLIVLGIIAALVICAGWPRHHDQVIRSHEVDGFTDSRRVCTEEMVPTLLPDNDPLVYTGVAVSELTGIYRVIGSVQSNDVDGYTEEHQFVCAVVLKDNTTWVARELRLI